MRVGSLFAGLGGIDIAFKRVGFDITWANEIDENICKIYQQNFPDTELCCGDIRKISVNKIPDFEVLTAGFPCQPFSICGMQKGLSDIRGQLFYQIVRVVRHKEIPIVFLENVANLVGHNYGKTFDKIIKNLEFCGYHIKYCVADACDYGAPQHRTRVYIAGFKDLAAYKKFVFPDKEKQRREIKDVIALREKAPEGYYLSTLSEEYIALSKRPLQKNRLYRFSDYGIQESENGIAFTLKANMGTWNNRIPYLVDDYGIRKITPVECLRLMGFPDDYVFPEIEEKTKYKACGNTVCVNLVEKIAKNIYSATV